MIVSRSKWQEFLMDHSKAHLLQLAEWGDLKAQFGWEPVRLVNGDAGAQILFRRLPLGMSIGYLPRGPVGKDWLCLMDEIDHICQVHHCISLKIEPDIWSAENGPDLAMIAGYYRSDRPIQPPKTVLIDLNAPEEEILGAMKQKTRYNIRLAQKKEIKVKVSRDIPLFQRMMRVTGKRDGFPVHSRAYYQKAFDLFLADNKCQLLMAYYEEKPLAGLMVFRTGITATYLYGASSDEERNRMPTYLLQWEAMCWAKKNGCKIYDLWGIPDVDDEELEGGFTEESGGLWGVYRFKRGFGGILRRTVGAYEKVYNSRMHTFLTKWLKVRL
jgi:lipid II:glycine glycyltransferase (peptidoglycan interpeptide bridge formation enzyme)